MTFDVAQHEAVIRRLGSSVAQLASLVQQVPAAATAHAGRWYVPDPMGQSLIRLSSTLAGTGALVVDRVNVALRCATAPFHLIDDIRLWGDVRGIATTFVGELLPAASTVDYHWKGRAADAYLMVASTQSAAAARIAVMADKTQAALGWSVSAMLAFYAGLLVVVLQFIAAFVAVLAALGSVVFSWAGFLLAFEKAKIGFVELGVLSALLAAALGTQVVQLGNLHSEAVDASAFPGGHWPSAHADQYTDASVADGDAEWSLER